jgi:hypothetical protein
MNADWLEIAKIVGAIVGLATGAFVTYWRIREKQLQKDHGLEDNPERCGRHEEAINTLKGRVDALDARNAADHGRIETKLQNIALEIVAIRADVEKAGK